MNTIFCTNASRPIRRCRRGSIGLCCVLNIGVLLLAAASLAAQPAESAPGVPPELSVGEDAPMTGKAVLGPGDTIRISSLSSEELTREWRISETGRLHLPLIGGIDVAGVTVTEFQNQLNERYREYINEPMIDVFLTDIQSRPVSVYGSIREPGTYQLKGPTSLSRLIQQTGGVLEGAFSVTLIRETDWGIGDLPKPKMIDGGKVRVDLSIEDVLKGYGPAADLQVRPYDMVRVETRPDRLVYIAGEVNNPGAVQLDTVDGVRLTKALALAGGYKSSAGYKHAFLYREDRGVEGAIPIHLRDVMTGKVEDIMLRDGDYLIVPPKGGFTTTLQTVASLIQPFSTTALVLRRF